MSSLPLQSWCSCPSWQHWHLCEKQILVNHNEFELYKRICTPLNDTRACQKESTTSHMCISFIKHIYQLHMYQLHNLYLQLAFYFIFFFLNNSLSTQCIQHQCIQSSPQHTSLFSPSLPIQLPHLSITSSRHTRMPLPYSSILSHPIHPNYTQLHPTTSKHTTLLLFLLVVVGCFFPLFLLPFFSRFILFSSCTSPCLSFFPIYTILSPPTPHIPPHTHTLPHLRLHTLPTFPHHF